MDHLEMVERLREKAHVSYEEATQALEACDWDLLDALLMLESEGRLEDTPEQPYSTQEQKRRGFTVELRPRFFARLGHALAGFIRKCNSVCVQIKKKDEVRLSLPLTTVLLLFLFLFWWVLAAALLGMAFGYRYAISGLSFDSTVNDAMDRAGKFIDSVVKPVGVKTEEDEEKEEE